MQAIQPVCVGIHVSLLYCGGSKVGICSNYSCIDIFWTLVMFHEKFTRNYILGGTKIKACCHKVLEEGRPQDKVYKLPMKCYDYKSSKLSMPDQVYEA